METMRYYHGHLDRIEDGPSPPPPPDVTEAEMLVFLEITIQMGHYIQNKLTRLLLNDQSVPHTILKHRYETGHIQPDMTDENSNSLCKMRNMFEILNMIFSKFYSPSEHLAVEEVFFPPRERVFSENTFPTTQKI
jgi:hypothetical protein